MINPCVLALLQASATTNLALKESHFLSLWDFLIYYRLKFYCGPKDKKDSWYTTMRFEDKRVFYKIPVATKRRPIQGVVTQLPGNSYGTSIGVGGSTWNPMY